MAQDFVNAPTISSPMIDVGKSDSPDHFTADEPGRYSFTWQLYGGFCSGSWLRAQIMKNGQLVNGTEIQIYSTDYDWPNRTPYYIGGLAHSFDLKLGDTVQLFFENPLLIDFIEFNVGYGGWTKRETQTRVDNKREFTAHEGGKYQAFWIGYGSSTDDWVDIFLLKNEEIVAESHGLLLDVNEPTNHIFVFQHSRKGRRCF